LEICNSADISNISDTLFSTIAANACFCPVGTAELGIELGIARIHSDFPESGCPTGIGEAGDVIASEAVLISHLYSAIIYRK
jgi:hypothetical protein